MFAAASTVAIVPIVPGLLSTPPIEGIEGGLKPFHPPLNKALS